MNKPETEPGPLLCPRPDLVTVRVTGSDARNFLHAQTTQAISNLPANGIRRAAWLNAKGRVRAILDVVADGESIWLVTDAAMAEQVVSQMSMYVLRADVQIALVGDRAIWSVVSDVTEQPTARELSREFDHPEYHTASTPAQATPDSWNPTAATGPEGEISYAIDDGLIMFITKGEEPPQQSAEKFALLPEGTLNDANLALIRRGIPNVSAKTFERYIPQMLNLDRLDAISFTKGCYPGQEIVARTTNLGEVKRRIQRFSASASANASAGAGSATTGSDASDGGQLPSPGDEIKNAREATVGEINRVATTAEGKLELLAVASLDATDREPLSLGNEYAVVLKGTPGSTD